MNTLSIVTSDTLAFDSESATRSYAVLEKISAVATMFVLGIVNARGVLGIASNALFKATAGKVRIS